MSIWIKHDFPSFIDLRSQQQAQSGNGEPDSEASRKLTSRIMRPPPSVNGLSIFSY